jgi:hypothetical protein
MGTGEVFELLNGNDNTNISLHILNKVLCQALKRRPN